MVQLLIVRVAEHRCGLRLTQIGQVVSAVEVTPLPGAPAVVMGVFDCRGDVLLLLSLRRRLGLFQAEISPTDIFVTGRTSGGRGIALLADGIDGAAEYAPDLIVPGEGVSADLPQIEGAVKTGDGLVIIHDLARFLAAREERDAGVALGKAGAR